ncbi:MAG: substrate-binding domain-containing protein [Bacteroidia bacterium]|nr:substrate-binding domain-containing protein [Bacteroidia bacterium]
MELRQISCLAAIFILLAAGNSCNRKNRKPELSSPTSGEVILFADESFSPIVAPLLQVFNGIYPYASVRCEFQPETDVLNALLKFQTPMVFVTRQLTAGEKDYFISKKYFPRENIFAMDAIALIVNPLVTDSLVSVGQIRDILTGKTRTWAQLGFTATEDSIHVVFDHTGSGTVRFMLDSICQGQPFGPGLSALKNNQGVIDFVANNPHSLGIIGVAWISNSRDPASLGHLKKVKVLRVSRTNPAVPENSFLPYQAFINDKTYPLIRRLYLINAEPRNGLATGVASFVCSDRGQRIILKTGIMPVYQTVRNVKITD